MNKRKVVLFLSLFLLSACSNKGISQTENPQLVFKKELMQIYSLYDNEEKVLLSDMTDQGVLDIINGMLHEANIIDADVSFSESKVGVVRTEGKMVNALKLPVSIKFDGDETSTREFFSKLVALENRILVNDIIISNKEDSYSTDCQLTFCGSQALEKKDEVVGSLMNIEELESTKNVEEKIVLRDNNFLMILRPFNSDSAAVSFGSSDDVQGNSYVYFDTNEKINFSIMFISEGDKYYCVYEDYSGEIKKTEFSLKGNSIVVDVLSCSKENTTDNIGVDLKITNKTDKNVELKVYDDKSNRVSTNIEGKGVEIR